ncbi:hypothetical protein ACWDRB_66555 [Nonomuraea sp. NPDC003707]
MLITADIRADTQRWINDDDLDDHQRALRATTATLLGIAQEQVHVTIHQATATECQRAARHKAIDAAMWTGC